MSKAVLISIRSEWCEKIANHQKTIEVRKTRPKIQTPFKVYIYCTKSAPIMGRYVSERIKSFHEYAVTGDRHNIFRGGDSLYQANGRVIGEFVCDRIIPWEDDMTPPVPLADMGMTYPEVRKYGGLTETLYLWHISDLVIYDKPKSLYDFIKPGRKSIDSLDEDLCKYCSDFDYGEKAYYGTPDGPVMCEGASCDKAYQAYLDDEGFTLYRPPQSWCYVEEI